MVHRLLRAAEEALIPGSVAHQHIVKSIHDDHVAAARDMIKDKDILGRVEREIEFECTRLDSFLNAAQVSQVRRLV